jgi:dephospho-CoA kinase
LGRSVFSLDDIASSLTSSDPGIREDLRSAFGPRVFSAKGHLDKRWLATVVFRDKNSLRKLNAIVHPRVLSVLRRNISRLPSSRRLPYIVVESALIFEARLEKTFDLILLVHAPLKLRISRAKRQKGLSRAEILRRVTNQITVPLARQGAQFSLSNTGNLANLSRSVRILDRVFTAIAGGAPKTP